jgi:hypothetical protein
VCGKRWPGSGWPGEASSLELVARIRHAERGTVTSPPCATASTLSETRRRYAQPREFELRAVWSPSMDECVHPPVTCCIVTTLPGSSEPGSGCESSKHVQGGEALVRFELYPRYSTDTFSVKRTATRHCRPTASLFPVSEEMAGGWNRSEWLERSSVSVGVSTYPGYLMPDTVVVISVRLRRNPQPSPAQPPASEPMDTSIALRTLKTIRAVVRSTSRRPAATAASS